MAILANIAREAKRKGAVRLFIVSFGGPIIPKNPNMYTYANISIDRGIIYISIAVRALSEYVKGCSILCNYVCIT